MGDRVAVLKRGVLQQVDTPQNLYDIPANVFVAGFIGSPSMNLVHSRIMQSGDDLQVQLGSTVLRLKAQTLARRPVLAEYVNREIVVGLRREDVEDADLATSGPDNNIVESTVVLIEALGAELIVHFTLDVEPYTIMDSEFEGDDAHEASPDTDGRYRYVGRFSPRSQVRVGDPVRVRIDAARLHYFDAETGSAL